MEGKHGYSSVSHHDHHSFHGYEQLRRVQGENEYLREKIKSCERGLVSLWQVSRQCVWGWGGVSVWGGGV